MVPSGGADGCSNHPGATFYFNLQKDACDMADTESEFEMKPDRLATFTDGIFAIAMTILVLELRVPEIPADMVASHLIPTLFEIWPNFVAYFLSFILLGIYWVGHHNLFHFIKRVDRHFLWINILFLMLVVLIPFSAALLGRYGHEEVAIIAYGINLIAIGFVLAFGWEYATRHHHLVAPHLKPEFVYTVRKLILFGPVLYVVAILLSFVNQAVSLWIYALVPLYYIFPNRIDQFLPGRHEHKHEEHTHAHEPHK